MGLLVLFRRKKKAAGTPSNLSATGGTQQEVLNWSAVSGAASYNVKRATVSGGPYTTVGTPTTNTFTDTGRADGTAYYYVVSAVVGGVESANSAEASALTLPAAPSLSAAAGSGQVVLTIGSVTSATSYKVYRGLTTGSETLLTSGVAGPTYTDSTVADNTPYFYKVSAVNASGEGAQSTEQSGTPEWTVPSTATVQFYTALPRDSTANGSAITQLTDYSGLGNHATQATVGLRALMNTTGINGNKAASFTAASLQRYALPSAVTGPSRGVSAFASWLPVATIPAPNNLLIFGASSPFIRLQGNYQSGGQLSINALAFTAQTSNFITPFLTASGPNVVGYRSSSTLQKLVWNGIRYAFQFVDAGTETGGSVGGDTGSNTYFNGLLQGVLLSGATVSDADATSILNQFKAVTNPTWYTPTRQIVHDGDSLTYGVQGTNANPYPAQMFRDSAFPLGTIHGANLGWPGAVLADLTSRAANTDSLYDGTLTQNVLVVWVGTNDISGAVTAATEYAALQTYIAARQSTGWVPVVLTMISRNLDASHETQRTTYNTDILGSGWVVADVGGDSQLGGQTSSLNTILFQADAVHLKDEGYYIVSSIVRDAIVSAYSSAVPAAPTNLVASPLAATIRLTWAGTSQKYNVYRGTAHGGPYTSIATNVAARTYVDTPPLTGVTYYYVVTAVNNVGESANSNEASMATATGAYDPTVAAFAPSVWYDGARAPGNDKLDSFFQGKAHTWGDSSGNARPVTQGTSTARPTWGTLDSNGRPYLRFAKASSQGLSFTGIPVGMQTTDFTAYAVVRLASLPGAANEFVWDMGDATHESGIWCAITSNKWSCWTHNTSGTGFTVTGSVVAVVGTLYRLIMVHNSTLQTNVLYVNGSSAGSVATTGTLSWGTSPLLTVGMRLNTTAFTDGDMYEAGEFPGALTSTDAGKLDAYLLQKFPS